MKIGIITHYYKSKNYGGNFQAYALTILLNELGYNAEQICVEADFNVKKLLSKKSAIKKIFSQNPINSIKSVLRKLQILFSKKDINIYNNKIQLRYSAFEDFNLNRLKHSEIIYTKDDIGLANNDYDVFITGSDQVWNFLWFYAFYFLDFVDGNKVKKISYAASISMDNLTEVQKNLFKKYLVDFSAVSVRESHDVELIHDLALVPVVQTLDPTLLLTVEDWNKVCAEKVIGESYVFCYFLGNNAKLRKLAKQYARLHNLKIVNLPHICGYQISDKNFADYDLYDIGPEKFLSLIKYSECIFTDSFHAVIFSHIYSKEFFVFNRSKKCEMSSRIYNITKIFEVGERYCDNKDKESMQYIEAIQKIDYQREFKELNRLKEFSINFLKENLKE